MTENRPWLQHYPKGVPANVDTNIYPSLLACAEDSFKRFGPKPVFTFMGKSISYSELDKLSRQFAGYLASRGLKPGDRIALMMPNCLQYPIAIFGALRAGLIIVNTNPLYTPREMEYQFNDAKVKAIIIAENFAYNLEKIIKQTSIEIIITTSIAELVGGMRGPLINFVIKYVKRMVPKYNLANSVNFKEALHQGKKFTVPSFASKRDDVIMLQYTGGTTGVSKAAMLTNANLTANVAQIKAVICYYLKEGGETALSPLPMYHILAFALNVLAMMSIGANTVLLVNARDIPSIVKAFKKYDISLIAGVNTLFNSMLNHPDFASSNFSKLKVSVAGGMALQTAVAERWQQVTGCYLSEGYGMTETSPLVSINPIDGTGKMGTIGLPVPSTDIRLMGDSGVITNLDEAGEIQVKGPQVMKGYYNKPEETSFVLQDGWLSTGDIGKMDADGYFRIVDRKKDMILVSGFKVFPNELEDVIMRHPKVKEVAAVGVPDEKAGEMVKVFIVKNDTSLDENEIIRYCKENLTNYKVPKAIEFRDELPKTNIGKILRRALRENN